MSEKPRRIKRSITYIVKWSQFDEDWRDDHRWRYYTAKREFHSFDEAVEFWSKKLFHDSGLFEPYIVRNIVTNLTPNQMAFVENYLTDKKVGVR